MGGPEFLIAIISVLSLFVFMPAIIIRGVIAIRRQNTEIHSGVKSRDSIGMVELQRAIEEAVQRANEPMQEQLDRLEERLDRIERRPQVTVPEASAYQPEAEPEKTAGRVRSKTS